MERVVLVCPPATALDVSAVSPTRSRMAVADDMLRSLQAFGSRVLPPGTPVSYLPGVGGLIVPEGTKLAGPAADGLPIFNNEWRTAQIGRSAESEVLRHLRRLAEYFRSDAWRSADARHLKEIGVAEYRTQTNASGQGVVIGVLDTGIFKHSDFGDRIREFVTVDPWGVVVRAEASDPEGHGTHVAGLIAGKHTGVAPCALLSVAGIFSPAKFCGTYAKGRCYDTVQFASGLSWLVSGRFVREADGQRISLTSEVTADVVNLSGGHNGEVPAYVRPIETARSLFGVQLIAAIGQDEDELASSGADDCPGHLSTVLGVGALDATGDVWEFGDFRDRPGTLAVHPKPDVVCPGGGQVHSCDSLGGYRYMVGTSMSCGLVTGVAALLLEQNPALRQDPVGLLAELARLTVKLETHRGARARHGRMKLS